MGAYIPVRFNTGVIAATTKIGRNQLCHCGSGLKYKKCHGLIGDGVASNLAFSSFDQQKIFERHRADERIRQSQQGLGRPIISGKLGDFQFVAVRNELHYSNKWRTFSDFLAHYIKQKLDPAWSDAELAKPLGDRHPILQWYDALCHYQKETIKRPGEVFTATVTGVVACYLGLAYSLYLLDHNVELQTRLIRRLKSPANFQGAFYELIVASALIRAGFGLTLEDETDANSKHCEFSAVSPKTGKKYWVEAKMRSVAGLLGKTGNDGGSDRKPIVPLIRHLKDALAKPATDERLIFIDLNIEPKFDAEQKPSWHDDVVSGLERYEKSELVEGVTAYVFVTNFACHRRLNETLAMSAAPFGLGMSDFNRPGVCRLIEIYRQKQKHIDAHNIGTALMEFAKFPSTFDGSLPSDVFGSSQSRVRIGETYFFQDVGESGLLGTVTSATVDDQNRAFISVTGADGHSHILRHPMTDAELADYRAHPDAYFGKLVSVSKRIEEPYELFEWFMSAYKDTPRETLLRRLAGIPNFHSMQSLSDEDLRATYCEILVAAADAKARA